MAEIEINETEANWAIGKLLQEAAGHLGLEKTGDKAVGYITDSRVWTSEPTPETARRATDSSVGRVYEVVLSMARTLQGVADVMQRQLVDVGCVLEAANVDLLSRVNAKLAEVDAAPGAGAFAAAAPDGRGGRAEKFGRPALYRGASSAPGSGGGGW